MNFFCTFITGKLPNSWLTNGFTFKLQYMLVVYVVRDNIAEGKYPISRYTIQALLWLRQLNLILKVWFWLNITTVVGFQIPSLWKSSINHKSPDSVSAETLQSTSDSIQREVSKHFTLYIKQWKFIYTQFSSNRIPVCYDWFQRVDVTLIREFLKVSIFSFLLKNAEKKYITLKININLKDR